MATGGAGGMVSSVELTCTPDQVADRMGQVMEAVGSFLTCTPMLRVSTKRCGTTCARSDADG